MLSYTSKGENSMKTKNKFTGRIGFIMAAAGSAVGLGNLWRFPYLAAKHGGGTFLVIYVILAVTFGFALMITEIAMGRRTERSVLTAYGVFNPKFKILGAIGALVPMIITPYYCVIGGWITHYMATYVSGRGNEAVSSSYFTNFITGWKIPLLCLVIYVAVNAIIVSAGVQKGIENFSKVLMPVLVILSIVIAIYGLTSEGGVDGLVYYLKPALHGATPEAKATNLVQAIIAAAGQLFYSLSIAMGILITYGSYMKRSEPIEGCVRKIEILDTLIAFIAGLIVVPSVFIFAGGEAAASTSGPSLMFVMLPKVFHTMAFGNVIGALFFFLVFLAALTSSIALMETIVAVVEEVTHCRRLTASFVTAIGIFLVGIPSMLGYGVWVHIRPLGMQFLDFFDFISNTIMMPILAFLTCILIGYVAKPKVIKEEVLKSETRFKSEKLYNLMIRYVAPIFLVAILATSIIQLFGAR